LGGKMKVAIKCVHPLLVAGVALFLLPMVVLPVGIADIVPASKAGPCSIPVFLLFVPGELMTVLGFGFSWIRWFEFSAERRKAEGRS
jgi:hypothetical protein